MAMEDWEQYQGRMCYEPTELGTVFEYWGRAYSAMLMVDPADLVIDADDDAGDA